MTPGKFNFPPMRKGDTYSGHSFELLENGEPVDLTGCAIKLQVKKRRTAPTVSLEWNTADGSIVVYGDDNNKIQLQQKSAMQMTLIACRYLYDLQVTFPDTTVKTYLEGYFEIVNDITQ